MPLIPAAYLLGLFIDAFAPTERAISRERELAADKVGAEAASAQAIGSSLAKLTAFTGLWSEAVDAIASSVQAGTPIANASDAFVGFVRSAPSLPTPSQLDAADIPHPTDSHPPLSERLAALGLGADSVQRALADVDPAEPAAALVIDAAAIEGELTSWVEGRIAARLTAASRQARTGKPSR